MSQHIVLTGATGLIGRPLVTHLLRYGYHCTVLSRNPTRATQQLPAGAQSASYATPPASADAVIHLAGETVVGLWTAAKKQRILQSRITPTQHIIRWMRQLKTPPHTFLAASAVGYYGHRPQETLTETSPPDPDHKFRAEVCLTWEAEANKAADLTRVVNLRIGNVFHPSGGYLQPFLRFYRLGLRFTYGDPAAMLPWISLTDTVRLIHFALENPQISGPLNLTAPHPASQADFAYTLNQTLFNRKAVGRIPPIILRIMLGEFAHALLDTQAILPAKALQHGFHFKHPTLTTYTKTQLKNYEV